MAEDVNAVIGVQVDTAQATAQLRALQAQIQQFTKSMAKSSASAVKSQRDFERNLVNNINASKQWTASFKNMQDATASFATQLDKNKLSMGEYFKYGMGATRTFGRAFDKEMRTVNDLAVRRVKALQTQYIQLAKDASGAMRTIAITPDKLDYGKYETRVALAAQKQQIFNDLVHKGTTQLVNFGKNTQWAGRQLMVGFTLPLAAFGATASKTFMELEQAAIRFKRVYGDLFTTTAETDAALKGVEDLAKSYTKYGIAVKDTISLAADLAAAGYQGAKLNEAIAQTNRLATLGNIDQQTAMKTTISLQNAFQISSQELGKTINFLNAVENQTVVSLDDLTQAIPRVAPVIKGLGGDVQDLAVFLAAMEEGGVDAAQAANALKSGMGSLINPTRAAKDMLGGLGINIEQIVSTNQGDLMGVVKGFAQALSTLSDFQKQQVLEKLFGKYQYARLGALFNNIIKDGTQANKAMELASSSAIELAYIANRELKAVEDATSTRFQAALENIKVAMAPIGKIFLQIVTPIIEFGTRALEAFNGLDDGVKKIIATVVATIAGVGPVLLMTVGLLANGIGNFLKFVNLLRNGFLKMTGQYQGVAAGSQMLTEAQLAGIAAANSLAAAEGNVTQALMVQREAVLGLASAYAQTLSGARGPMGFVGATQGKPRKYADGVISVPGSGNGDTVPAMLTPGEAIIPAAMAKKYAPLIGAMVSGKIPGYAEGRLGSGPSGRIGKSGITVMRGYQANVSNTGGLEGLLNIDPSNMADVSSIYAKEIAKQSGVSISAINKEVQAWEKANVAAIQAATQAVNSGAQASDAFGPLIEKFNADMKNAGGAVAQFAQTAEQMMPQLQQDLIEAQTYSRNLGLDIKKADDAVALAKAIPNNKLAAGASTPGNFQSMSRVRQAAGSIFGGREGVGLLGIPRFMISKSSKPKDPAYLAASSQEHFSQTPESKANLIAQKKLRDAAKSSVDELADATAKAQQSASPAERSAKLGDDWAKGYAQGIERSTPLAADAAEESMKIVDKRASQASNMLGMSGVPMPPPLVSQTAQAEGTGKKSLKNRAAGLALRALKIDSDSIDKAARKQTDVIEQETATRRTSMEGFKTFTGRLMAGSMAVDSVAIGMSMMGGEVGEVGQKLLKASSAVTALSMVLPMLTSPLGLLTLGVVGAGAAYMLHKSVVEDSARSIQTAAQEQADAMTGSALAVAEFGKAVGMQSIAEKAQQRRLGSEQASVFYQALTSGDMASTLSSYIEARSRGGAASVVAGDVKNLALQYDFTSQDVDSYLSAVAEALGDSDIKFDVRAQLVEMLYSDGNVKKDLLENPSIPIDIVAQIKTGAGTEKGALATSVATNGFVGTLGESARLVNAQSKTNDMNAAAQQLGFNNARELAQAVTQATKYNQATGMAKFKQWAGMDTKAGDIAALQTRASGQDSKLPGTGKFASPEEAKTKLLEINDIVSQYNSSLQLGLQNTNGVFKAMDNQRTALELLKQEYETTDMTLQEFRQTQNEINSNQEALTKSLNIQAQAAKDAGTFEDWKASTMNLIGIQVAASDASDGLKSKFEEMTKSVKDLGTATGSQDIEINFATSFKNFDGSLEEFMVQWETLQGMFKDKEVASEVSVWMSQNSIDLEYINEIGAALAGLESIGIDVIVDGQVTAAAIEALNTAYQLAQLKAGNIVATSANLREGRGPISSDPASLGVLRDLPGKTGPTGPTGDKTGTDPTGGSGKGTKKTWVQKQLEQWEQVKSKIQLEEAEVDRNFIRNFGANFNQALNGVTLPGVGTLTNNNGQLTITVAGTTLDLGTISTPQNLQAALSKIELNKMNLEQKKMPIEDAVKGLNRQVDKNNRTIELNQRKIEKINKAYDQQSTVLDKVAKVQDYINKQRASQLSLAEALSSGDLSAAVRAASQAQADQSSFMIQNQKDAIEEQKTAAVFAYEKQNEALGEINQTIQDQIYDKEQVLQGINDQVDAYTRFADAIGNAQKRLELLRDIQKSTITVGGSNMDIVNAETGVFGAADQLLGSKGTEKNYNSALAASSVAEGLQSSIGAALNANKDALRVDFSSASMTALSQQIADMMASMRYNAPQQSMGNMRYLAKEVGSKGAITNVTSTNDPVYNVVINVSGTNSSPQDIANAVYRGLSQNSVRGYNY